MTYISAGYAAALAVMLSPLAAWLWIPAPLLWIALAVTAPAAALTLWRALPRPIAFRGPGLQANAEEQTRLLEFLRRAAWLTIQPRPARVMIGLAADASAGVETNAWGFGARRLMVLGLPLLHVLSVAELTTVVCRQMGFFSGARALLWALLTHFTRFLRPLGVWPPFERAVEGMKYRQYAAAREAVATLFGMGTVETAEGKAAAASLLFPMYWDQDVAPALAAGLAPPLLAGFDRYVDALAGDRADLLEAREVLRSGRWQEHPAAGLLDNLAQVECELLELFADARLQSVSWEEVGARAYLAPWRGVVSSCRDAVEGITPESLPEAARDLAEIGNRVLGPTAEAGDAREAGHEVLSIFLSSWLEQAGWAFDYRGPGDARTFSRGSETVDPATLVAQLAAGEVEPETWREWCRHAGVTALPIAA